MKKRAVALSLLVMLLSVSAFPPPAFAVNENDNTDQTLISIPDADITDETEPFDMEIHNNEIVSEVARSVAKEQNGTIIVSFKDSDTPIEGAEFSAYKIGDRNLDDYTLSFSPVDELKNLDINFYAPDDDDIKAVASAIRADDLSADGTATTDRSGSAAIDVTDGLYLIVQTNNLKRYKTPSPSLVSVPGIDGSYNVSVLPKAEYIPEEEHPDTPNTPDENPDTPKKSNSPKTGVADENYSIVIVIITISCVGLCAVSLLKRKLN